MADPTTAGDDVEKAAVVQTRTEPETAGAVGSEGVIRMTSSNLGTADEPPDGGWTAWSQVVPAHIATALCWGYGTGFAVFQLYYKETMNLPAAQVSWIGSIQLFLYFVVGLFSGRLSDAGYTRQLYFTGTVMTCFGMFMTSLATEYWQIILAQGICNGIGGGLAFMPAIANVGMYFKKKRVLAMSINACGSSTGAIIFPAIVQYLTPQIGFPWAVRVCGFVALFLSIIGGVLLVPRKVPRNTGPMMDWGAFKDTTFAIFSLGSFLIFFSVFTLLIYVSSPFALRSQPSRYELLLLLLHYTNSSTKGQLLRS
jgi:MCP family monocarboxylic acid transporter-like MFS transporter 3